MYFSDRIKLRAVTNTITNGYPTQTATEREVWADKRSAKRTEFYQANANGMRADCAFTVNAADYKNERELEFSGQIFDVIRAYQTTIDRVELTCQRRE